MKDYQLYIHQNVSNCTNFFKFPWGSIPPNPPSKGHMASISCGYIYAQRIALTHANLHFRKEILTLYQILYTLPAYMCKLIKDMKYKF